MLFVLLIGMFLLGCELTPFKRGRVVHLGVGLSYQDSDVTPLFGALNDSICISDAFQMLFQDREFESISGGDTLTKTQFMTILQSLKASMKQSELLIITYSGHGLTDGSWVFMPEGRKTLLLADGEVDPSCLVSVNEFFEMLQGFECSLLVIIDSCYCGHFVQPSGSSVPVDDRYNTIREAYSRYFADSSYRGGPFVLAATESDNTSKEPAFSPHPHGYFTQALLEGLGYSCREQRIVKPRDLITIDFLYHYILTHQRIPTGGAPPPFYQHPVISGGPGDLILFMR
jgi:hypothetical protein